MSVKSLTGKMSTFGAIFEVNTSIYKLWALLGHFGEKDAVDFNKCHFVLNYSIMLYVHIYDICVIFAQTV